MVVLRNRVNRINSVAIFTLSCVIFLVSTTRATPQPRTDSNDFPVKVGIRKTVPQVENFCRVFGRTLESKEGWSIEYPSVVNQYIRRFEGLQNQKDGIDIECGSNSIDSGTLLDQQGNRFLDTIAFSEKFYETGTKLLLRRDLAEDLAASTPDKFTEKLKNLSIVVTDNTTTSQKLNNMASIYSRVFPVKSTDRFNARDRALDALESKQLQDGTPIQAFASDAVIVQALFQYGVNEEGEKGQPYYQKYRGAYKKTSPGFVVFPSKDFPSPLKGNYLPYLSSESYAMAVRKEDSGKWLEIIDNQVLIDLKDKTSKLAQAREEIRQFEEGGVNVPSPKNKSPLPTTPSPISPPIIDGSDKDNNSNWWVPVAAVITACAPILVAILNPQFASAFVGAVKNRIRKQPQPSVLNLKRLHGSVLDISNGTGIQGAQISLRAGEIPLVESTDAEGHFFFSFKSSGDVIRIYIKADGYKGYDRLVTFPEEAGRVTAEFRLSRVS